MACEFFQAITKAANAGDRFVIVRAERGGNVITDIVLNGKPMLGLVRDPRIVELAEEALRKGRAIEKSIGEFRVRVEPSRRGPRS